MNLDEAAATVRAQIRNRRRNLEDSGLEDLGTQILIWLLERTVVTWGDGTVKVTLTAYADSIGTRKRRYVDSVLSHALDAVPGTVVQRDELTYVLTPTGKA